MKDEKGVQKEEDSITGGIIRKPKKKLLCNQALEYLYKSKKNIEEHTILGPDQGVIFFSNYLSYLFLYQLAYCDLYFNLLNIH